MTVEPDAEHTCGEWTILCAPGVHTGWALHITETSPPHDGGETNSAINIRIHASTLLEVEEAIAAHLTTSEHSATHIVHSLGARDFHFDNGSQIEARWEPVVVDWRCLDCGVDTDAIAEYYMVDDPVWDQAINDDPNGHLCIKCLERRLGRTLHSSDFTARDINTNPDMPRSKRLAARLLKESAAHPPPR